MTAGYRSFIRQDLQQPLQLPFKSGCVMLFTMRAPGRESPNEDAAAVVPFGEHGGVLIVADGLGGAPSGHEAARLSVEHIARAVRDAQRHEQSLRDGILDGIEKANAAIVALGVGAATTLAVVEIQRDICRTYHVGDSMVLVTGQRGRIKFRTIPHSPVGYAVESGMLDAAAAANHVDRHIVSNVLGSGSMRIDIGPALRLAARDTIIVASDGVSDNLFDAEIVDLIRTGPLARCSARLMAECRRCMALTDRGHPGKPDDMTFILFRRAV